MPIPEISRPMEDGELREMTRDETKFFIIGMLMPIRIGVGLFGSLLEYRHYPPGTLKNDWFQLVLVNWEHMIWGIMSIPIKDKVLAERIAQECGLRLADGVPSVINPAEPEGVIFFPVTDSERILTLEYIDSSHIGYTNDQEAIENLTTQESILINRVYNGELGPVDFKVLREGD
jgi:hypothetical protein